MALAKDVMKSTDIVKVDLKTSVLDAVKEMYRNRVGSVLVVDGEVLKGVFTERDLIRVVSEEIPLDTEVGKVMSSRLITAYPEETIFRVASKMIEHHIRHIPVVDNEGRLLGIISIRDVLRYMASTSVSL